MPLLLLFQFVKLATADGPACSCISSSLSAAPVSVGHPEYDSYAVPPLGVPCSPPRTQGF